MPDGNKPDCLPHGQEKMPIRIAWWGLQERRERTYLESYSDRCMEHCIESSSTADWSSGRLPKWNS